MPRLAKLIVSSGVIVRVLKGFFGFTMCMEGLAKVKECRLTCGGNLSAMVSSFA